VHDDVARVPAPPAVRNDRIVEGAEPGDESAAEFARFIAAEQAKWAMLVQDPGIVIERARRGGTHRGQR